MTDFEQRAERAVKWLFRIGWTAVVVFVLTLILIGGFQAEGSPVLAVMADIAQWAIGIGLGSAIFLGAAISVRTLWLHRAR